jgi:hypothetical protein
MHNLALNRMRSEKGLNCGSHLILRKYLNLPEESEKLAGGIFCQQRHHCVFCCATNASRALSVGVPKLVSRLTDRRELRPAMLTLTCQQRSDLGRQADELLGAFQKWGERCRNYRKGRRGHSALAHLDGGILSCETKRAKWDNDKWHFHAHAIVMCEPGLTKEEFYPEWSELLGYTANLDFRYCDSAKLIDEGKPHDEIVDQISSDCLEVFKYALKTTQLEYADRYEAAGILHGRKLVRPFGSMHGFKMPDDCTDDLSRYEGQPFLDRVFRYLNGRFLEGTYHAYPRQLDASADEVHRLEAAR